MTFSWEETIDMVTAANIAGYMERSGKIALSDDEELASFIIKQLGMFADATYEWEAKHPGDDSPLWHDWIEEKLKEEYGP